MNLIDNRKHGKVFDSIKESVKKDSKVSIISSAFSIYAYSSLKKELDKIESLNFLFSNYDPEETSLLGNENERKLNKFN